MAASIPLTILPCDSLIPMTSIIAAAVVVIVVVAIVAAVVSANPPYFKGGKGERIGGERELRCVNVVR
jgi:hypothetical protein